MERAEVLPSPRDIDPRLLCWKGGAVAGRLESVARDGWITAKEWERYGIPLLKERLYFLW